MSSRKESKESPIVILTRALPPAVVGTMVLQIAGVVGCLMIGSVALGLLADARFGVRPIFTLLFAIISLFVSVWLTYRIALRTSARAQKAYQTYLDKQRAATQQPGSDNESSLNANDPLKQALPSDR